MGGKNGLRFEKKLCFYQVHIAVQSLKLRIKTLKYGTNWKLCSPESSLSLINEIFFHGKIKRKNRYFCKHMIFTIALIGIEEYFRGKNHWLMWTLFCLHMPLSRLQINVPLNLTSVFFVTMPNENDSPNIAIHKQNLICFSKFVLCFYQFFINWHLSSMLGYRKFYPEVGGGGLKDILVCRGWGSKVYFM